MRQIGRTIGAVAGKRVRVNTVAGVADVRVLSPAKHGLLQNKKKKQNVQTLPES